MPENYCDGRFFNESHTVHNIPFTNINICGKDFKDVPSLDWLAAAVREKLDREEPCAFCGESWPEIGVSNCSSFKIGCKTLLYCHWNENYDYINISYCPKCGGKLEI